MASSQSDLAAGCGRSGRPTARRSRKPACRSCDGWRELERRRQARAAFHRSRYGGGDRTDERTADARVVPVSDGRPGALSRYSRRQPAVNVDIEQARETLAAIEETTWRMRLREIMLPSLVPLIANGKLRDHQSQAQTTSRYTFGFGAIATTNTQFPSNSLATRRAANLASTTPPHPDPGSPAASAP